MRSRNGTVTWSLAIGQKFRDRIAAGDKLGIESFAGISGET